ncbi:hypothetical protein [Corynebacterium kalidii]|uniref:Uncharacterized protein n=1 Tax=Corynebacterium kalidii TaxID=2931982 RepID=A0A9X2AZB8_9CORY|nr:hypothetical protein [Corynebacterium kalidii]MCJ7858941.1 hypothetical protein [Corynebacterium kalidii]
MAESRDGDGRWGVYDARRGEGQGAGQGANPGTDQGANQGAGGGTAAAVPPPGHYTGPVVPPRDPFSLWTACGLTLFVVGALAAVVCFGNSSGTEVSGSGWGRTTVDVVYMDVLLGAVCCSVLSGAGLIVAAVAKVGSQMAKASRSGGSREREV